MRYLVQSTQFKRDLKRLNKSGQKQVTTLNAELRKVVYYLTNDIPLSILYHDHALIGEMTGYRECHLSFDFLLVYRFEGDDILHLVRLGTHSEALGL